MDDKSKVYGVDVSKANLEIGRYEVKTTKQINNSAESIAAARQATSSQLEIERLEELGAYGRHRTVEEQTAQERTTVFGQISSAAMVA